MINNLKIAKKLSLIMISFVFPILILLYLLVETHQWRIDFAKKEIAGNVYLVKVRQLQESLQQYHLSFLENKPQQTEIIGVKLTELQEDPQKQADMLNVSSSIRTLNELWHSAVSKRRQTPEQVLTTLNALQNELKTTMMVVGDESNLILDPDLDTYYLMDAVLLEIPKLTDAMLQTLLFSQQLLLKQTPLSLDEKVRMISLLGSVELNLEATTNALELAGKHNKDKKYARKRLIKNTLTTPLEQSEQKTHAFLKLAQEQIVQENTLALPYQQLKAIGQQALMAQFSLCSVAGVELNALLEERVHDLNTIKYLQVLMVVLLLVLSILLCIAIVRAITVPLQNAQKIMAELATGHLDLTVKVTSEDETGKVLASIALTLVSLKKMVLRIIHATQNLIGTFHELEKHSESMLVETKNIQSDAGKILAESTNLNQSVNENVQELKTISGKITSLTAAIEELSTNISTISYNSEQSSRNMSAVSKNIQQVSMNIHTLSSSVQQMSAALSTISDSAKETSHISATANQNVKELSFTMNELHQSSERIGKIVKLISNIAGKTNMLALNATIEAATAGEAGRGFAVVASEIKNLAQQTVTANNEIEDHIFQVQSHIQQASNNTETVSKVISRVAEINQKVEASILEEHQCANEIAVSIRQLADAGNNASFNIQQAEQGLWEINRAVNEAFLASKEVVTNIEEGNRDLQSVTKRSITSLDQLKSVHLHISSIQGSITSIYDGNQHLYEVSHQVSAHVDVLKNSVASFTLADTTQNVD